MEPAAQTAKANASPAQAHPHPAQLAALASTFSSMRANAGRNAPPHTSPIQPRIGASNAHTRATLAHLQRRPALLASLMESTNFCTRSSAFHPVPKVSLWRSTASVSTAIVLARLAKGRLTIVLHAIPTCGLTLSTMNALLSARQGLRSTFLTLTVPPFARTALATA